MSKETAKKGIKFDAGTDFEPALNIIKGYKKWSGYVNVEIGVRPTDPVSIYPNRDAYVFDIAMSSEPVEEVNFVGLTFYTTRLRQNAENMALTVVPGEVLKFFEAYGRPNQTYLSKPEARKNILACIDRFKEEDSGSIDQVANATFKEFPTDAKAKKRTNKAKYW